MLAFGDRKGTIGRLQYNGEPDGLSTGIVASGQPVLEVVREGNLITTVRAGDSEVQYSYTDNQLTGVTDVICSSQTPKA